MLESLITVPGPLHPIQLDVNVHKGRQQMRMPKDLGHCTQEEELDVAPGSGLLLASGGVNQWMEHLFPPISFK